MSRWLFSNRVGADHEALWEGYVQSVRRLSSKLSSYFTGELLSCEDARPLHSGLGSYKEQYYILAIKNNIKYWLYFVMLHSCCLHDEGVFVLV